jgi:uncharacterized protein (TIGR02246 family)
MEEIRETIRNTNLKFAEAFKRGDAAAVAALYTSDARLLPPEAPMMTGTEAIKNFWQGAMNLGIKEATLETLDVESSGDNLACEIGKFTLSIEAPGGERTAQMGKYIVLWKNDGGTWKLQADIWNTNAPA